MEGKRFVHGGVRKYTMYEEIADRLEEMILSDVIKTDEKLPSEQFLATSFGVSRPVIREALMLLSARGLIVSKNGVGSYVSNTSGESFNQSLNRLVKMSDIDSVSVFEVRIPLETMACRLAAERASEDDIRSLEDNCAKMADAGRAHDMERQASLDVDFHVKIAEMSGNPLLLAFIGSLAKTLESEIGSILEKLPNADYDGLRYHIMLTDQLRNRDGESAAETMRRHIVMSMRNAELSVAEKCENSGEPV